MRVSNGLAAMACAIMCLAGAAAHQGEDATGTPCASADYLSATIAADRFDFDKASDMFRACLLRDGANTRILARALFYTVASGRVAKSAALAKTLADNGVDAPAAHLVLAVVAAKQHDYAAVLREADAVKPGVFLIAVWAHAGKGDRIAALAALDALGTQEKAALPLLFTTALLEDYFGNGDAADAAYRKALETLGPLPRLIDGYGRFLERAGRGTEAQALYSNFLRSGAHRPLALAGLERLKTGRKPDALVKDPVQGIAEALFGVAAAMNDASNIDSAIFYLRLVQYLRPDFDLAQMLLADRFSAIGKSDLAIKVYDDIDTDAPYYVLAALQRMSAKIRSGDTVGALADGQALAKDHPDDIDVWTSYGDVLLGQGRHGEAVAAYTKAIDLSGPPVKAHWRLYFSRATAAFEEKNWPQAEEDLRTALRINPEEPLVLNFLGYSWVDQGSHLDEALGMLQKAAKLSPDSGFIADSVGWAYFRLGRYADAVAALEQAVTLSPDDPTINDHLGDAYWRIGRQREAGFQWSHALSFGAEGGEREKIEKKLEVGLVDGK